MLIKTQDNSILNLASFDALKMVYKGSYYKSEWIISGVIFDADGDVAVEKLVCEFRSEDEAISYLEEIETNTAYVTIAKRRERERTLLNLARFHSLEFFVKDVSPVAMAGKGMEEHLSHSTQKESTTTAIQYDALGSVLKTVVYRAKFASKEAAVDWFEQLTKEKI